MSESWKNRAKAALHINPEQVAERLVHFLQDEVAAAGLQHAVVGVSGGVDSAVVAMLCRNALGAGNVLGVTMPYTTSGESTRRDGHAMVQLLGIPSIDVPITEQVDAYQNLVDDMGPIRLGNKCARERMSILYDQSAEFHGLVVGTSNKSELLLGYGTHYGDCACAINPIGDLYKTQVYTLAKHLGVPQAILDKPPSADLWPGQTDEGELGVSYAEVDEFLMALQAKIPIDQAPPFAEAVLRRIALNKFKGELPIVARISA